MTPMVAECAGLWRRTLLIEADGSRDTGTTVLWLQGISTFVDVRGAGEGFAGQLDQRVDVFEWARLIDMQPAGLPDAGQMSWDGDTLVETGVHADYTEHWRREPGPTQPCWGLLLSAGEATAILLQVGTRFGWAYRRAGEAEVSLGEVHENDWRITESACPDRVGAVLRLQLTEGRLCVDDDMTWDIKESEGSVTL